MDTQPTDATSETAPSRDRTIRHLRSVHDLLERRTDLVGVVPMADLIRESVQLTA